MVARPLPSVRENQFRGHFERLELQTATTANDAETAKKKIAERDNYTCQNCGKYMPDGVGLHIDHIIPVIKGGKTVESNLQVLCSKCNGRKGGR